MLQGKDDESARIVLQVFVKRFRTNVLAAQRFGSILAAMKIYVAFVFCWCAFTAFAQQPSLTKTQTQVLAADAFVGYDNFGFEYFIADNVFCKRKDDRTLEYKNLSLGKITRADLHNPLQIALFYEPFNTVVLVDNQLNETHRINFSEHVMPIVASAIGMASANRLWVFNSLSQRIGLFDYLKKEYREITVPFTGKVAAYDSDFNFFHWIDEGSNRWASDVYGKVSDYGPTVGYKQFTVVNNNWILFAKDSILYAHSIPNNQSYPLEIGEKSFKSFHYQAQNLAIFTEQGITNYKITLP